MTLKLLVMLLNLLIMVLDLSPILVLPPIYLLTLFFFNNNNNIKLMYLIIFVWVGPLTRQSVTKQSGIRFLNMGGEKTCVIYENLCFGGCGEEETVQHLYVICPYFVMWEKPFWICWAFGVFVLMLLLICSLI